MSPLVEVLDWTPAWEERFARAQAELLMVLPADATIEHVGSTSVPGLAANPIIDILVTTSRVDELRTDLKAIQALGYCYNPKDFADDLDHLFLRRDADGRRTEHLHIFHPRSQAPQSDRTFRDYLIAHPNASQRYGEAKRAAAQSNPESRVNTAMPRNQYCKKFSTVPAHGPPSQTTSRSWNCLIVSPGTH